MRSPNLALPRWLAAGHAPTDALLLADMLTGLFAAAHHVVRRRPGRLIPA